MILRAAHTLTMVASMALFLGAASAGYGAEKAHKPVDVAWPFEKPMGYFEKPAIQRGFQVYKEVCSVCHGIKRLAFRNLEQVGFTEKEVKKLAASYSITDGPNDQGEMYQRPGRPSDYFPSPYDNEQAARAANNGAYPPDLSLIVKARKNGADYLYSLLTGYEEAPEGVELGAGQYYNPYMAGGKIGMPAPLMDGQVEYMDGTSASVDQMARDVTMFLHWAAEPKMQERKALGLKIMGFLLVMTVVFYLTKKRIWKDVEPG